MEKAGTSRNKKILTAVVVVLIIVAAGGAGFGLRWWQDRDKASEEQTAEPRSGISFEVDDIQDLRARGDLAGAEAKIDEALANPNVSNKERYNLYIQRGNGLFDSGDHQGALAAYKEAEGVDATFEITVLLGDTYRTLGDKAKAIEYYKNAIPITPDTPIREDEIKGLEADIARLESQP